MAPAAPRRPGWTVPRDLAARIVTLAIALPLVIYLTVGAPPLVLRVAVAALVFGAAWEAISIGFTSPSRGARIVGATGATLLHFTWVRVHEGGGDFALATGAGALLAIVVAGFRVARAGRRRATASMAVVGVVSGIPLAYLVLLPATWVLLAVVLSWSADIGGYVGGSLREGRPVAPTISPRKTWIGVASGWVFAVGGALVMHARFSLSLGWTSLGAVAIVAAVLSQGGDLLESWFKRRHGVKDSGDLLPATGGVLDVIDGLSLVAPFLYVVSLFR